MSEQPTITLEDILDMAKEAESVEELRELVAGMLPDDPEARAHFDHNLDKLYEACREYWEGFPYEES